ncbi:nucleotide-binding protein [Hyphomicrobium sp.]|uniref:nucleotide-binding protein n=1 Tax=Hyphomicrobium sp. TaxID=82 RepID=UPI002CC2CB5F|nr:nucleotide-binding protein [Hyphomicrobium sp.]HRN89629.1 nucleotide-binding protein [Hyphomicrobium sp.]HRQ27560.1 nucleotide-binding protein [Hyphomicrobium sp.]
MARRPVPHAPTRANLTVEQMHRGVQTIERRISELEEFNAATATEHDVSSIEQSIDESLERVFGGESSDFQRYKPAATPLDQGPWSFNDHVDRRPHVSEGRERAIATLKQAIKALKERIDEAAPVPTRPVDPASHSTRIFIVHGRDGETKHEVARFLNSLGLAPVILDEQASEGRTLIEKFEAHSDVGFAVVLLTPDDEGALKGASAQPRARQNVVLELGFFVGKLGRQRVASIVRGQSLELPSDIHGLVWMRYEEDWKLRLARELKAAGYDVDMNKAV